MNRLNQVLKQLTLSALVIMATVNTFAADKKEGGNAGGGGKGIVCRDENFVEKIYLADTMDYVKAGGLKQFARTTDDESVLKAIAELVEKTNPQKIYPHPLNPAQKVSLAYLLEYNQQKLSWGINFELSNVDDDHIDPASLPAGCKKVQLAFTNLMTGEMSLNPNFEHKMTWIQRGFLKLHEVLIAVRGTPGADDLNDNAVTPRVSFAVSSVARFHPPSTVNVSEFKALAPRRIDSGGMVRSRSFAAGLSDKGSKGELVLS